jgi:type I restriction enzyme S subunit
MSELPAGWVAVKLADLGDWASGGTPSRNVPGYFGGVIPWVKTGDLRHRIIDEVEETITQAGLDRSAAKLFPPGTLLVAMYGATIGQTGVLSFQAATNQACAALLPNGSTSEIIPYVWRYLIAEQQNLKAIGQGGAQPNISQTIIKDYHARIAPLHEQRRIVAKIDSLSGKSQRARAHLDHIPRLVEKYKQVVMGAAFRSIEDKADETSLEQLAVRVTSGSRDWSQYYDRGDCVFVLAGNIKPMAFDPKPRQFVDPPLDGSDAKRTRINVEDLLFTIVGANTGDVCRVSSPVRNYFVCQSVALVRLREPERARFIELFLNTEAAGKAQIEKVIYGQGRPHLSFADLKRLRIPVIDVMQTQAFVKRLDEAFEMIDRFAAGATSARKLIDHLERAVLTKAFRGELVPQDPADEPAGVLLERIRAEREGRTTRRGQGQ